jgi:hypothetical protein
LAFKINEGFEVNDLKLVLSSKLHIDEYKSKIGKDSDIIVVSFLLHDKQAAIDLVNFVEIGYDFVLDADVSASEIATGSFLVFVEFSRRKVFIKQLQQILSDLRGATGYTKKEWKFAYLNGEKYYPVTMDYIKELIPLTPHSYKMNIEESVDDYIGLAGLYTIVESASDDSEVIKFITHAGL